MELSSLRPPKGSRKAARRIGRGQGSNYGRTSGRGEKGQKARAGASIPAGFEGGQMPLYRRLPKRGFISKQRVLGTNQYHLVNVKDLNRFEDGSQIDWDALKAVGLAKNNSKKAGVKILGFGELSKKVNLKVHAVTASAKQKIEAAGGSVELLGGSGKAEEAKAE